MIRTEQDYQSAQTKLQEERARLQSHRERLAKDGLPKDQVDRLMEPLESFHLQLQEEVEAYEQIKRGNFEAVTNLGGMGRMLIGFRIFLNMTQADLAEKLGVSEAAVSRDERNEYHNITLTKAQRVLDALGVMVVTRPDERFVAQRGMSRKVKTGSGHFYGHEEP